MRNQLRSSSRARRLAAAFALAPLSVAAFSCGDDTPPEDVPPDNQPPEYADPAVLEPNADGVFELRFGPTEVTIDGKRYCVPAYNGQIPGPTLRIPAGTDRRVRVNLHNEFTKSDYHEVAGLGANGTSSCHDFNVTNLHGHGLHVQPNYTTPGVGEACAGEGCGPDGRFHGDNVLIQVEPGESAQYRWDIDEFEPHHEGTDWYHPHVHGATAIQVSSGAAGAMIIEGPTDDIPGISTAKERVMVMNMLPLDADDTVPLAEGEACTEDNLSFRNFLPVTESMPALINGKLKPVMTTPPGQVERWRFVHAGNPDEVAISLHRAKDDTCDSWEEEKIELTQIARDGITMQKFFVSDEMWVSPGYRVDALVKMPQEKQTLCLVSTPEFLESTAIAVLKVDPAAGDPTETNMPDETALADVAPPTTWTASVDGVETEVGCDTVTTVHQKIVLLVPTPGEEPETVPDGDTELTECDPNEHDHGGSTDGPPCVCPAPNINCRKFEDRRARNYRSDRVMTVDTSERWEISGFDGHPFHIHINPFLACPNQSNKEPNFPHWRDTMFVMAAEGPRQVLTHFKSFTGQFVIHCHKLNHEDEGMMELVEICKNGDEECLCQRTENGECILQSDCQVDDLQCQFAKEATAAYPGVPAPNLELCGPETPGP
ncbi:MAG: multicopper oxidase domain-containing protein [Polyangiaceae bacterium]|nr:multicopper oxidase domain-containing protein [Polyangiaceae bacterium]